MNVKFPTRVKLDASKREILVASLNSVLATSMDLYSQVKQAHWNLKGPQFFARHELFDQIAARLLENADTAAERASTLGGYANGTIRLAAEKSKIGEYDLSAVDGKQHVKVLADRYASYAEMLRDSISIAERQADPATEDLFTEMLRNAELDMWFLESHLMV